MNFVKKGRWVHAPQCDSIVSYGQSTHTGQQSVSALDDTKAKPDV